MNNTGLNLTSAQIEAGSAGFWGLVTGWGAPPITAAAVERDPELRIIAHSAGSPKAVLSQEVADGLLAPRGIVTFSANGAIALNVAESTVGMLLMTARHWIDFNNHYKDTGEWRNPKVPWNVLGLSGSVVGIVSASAVGREVIRLLQPWRLKLICYDPYMTSEQLGALGAEKVELDELFERSDHVTLHAPATPETERMIGAHQLALLRDGATLVNTSRGWVLDHDALLAECQRGRLYVCLDVTTPEPLPPDSPFRALTNVYITPHLSGAGRYGYLTIGEWTLAALRACRDGQPVQGAVDYSRYATLA
jgi:phosphoglycerate dehydrogenase-like enzyme